MTSIARPDFVHSKRVPAPGAREVRVAHLTASRSLGGKERQILELSAALPAHYRSLLVAYPEGGLAGNVIEAATAWGLESHMLVSDFPHVRRSVGELAELLQTWGADALLCHGYKAKLLGLWAARRAGVLAIGVSHGWTAESWKVRLYEAVSRQLLHRMDHVVCVSQSQAERVARRTRTPRQRISVICDAVRASRFDDADERFRHDLLKRFTAPIRFVVGAAGRLSPEKNFSSLVEAAAKLCRRHNDLGFVLFGDGPLRGEIEAAIARLGVGDRFHLFGQCDHLDQYYPFLDVLVLPSFTEGLPNVVLEAFAAAVPVVATAVGGTPELVEHGANGFLVRPGDSDELAHRIEEVLRCENTRQAMGQRGQERVTETFTFEQQSRQYQVLIERLLDERAAR